MIRGDDTPGSRWLGVGAVFAGIGVAFGAFGAHGLRGLIAADLLQVFETGVRYHLIHALAIIGAALAMKSYPGGERWFRGAALLFLAGILLFSGSLYLLALTGVRDFGWITPFGGICFLGGWLFLTLGAFRRN